MSTSGDSPNWLEELANLTEALSGGLSEAQAAAAAGGECPSCPVCTGLALLRSRHPEAHEHLTAAMSAMMTLLRDSVPVPAPGPEPAAAVPVLPWPRPNTVKSQPQIEVTD